MVVKSRLDTEFILRVRVPLYDGAENPVEKYIAAVRTLDALIQSYGKVLVHCVEGRSRSPFIVLCYLAWKNLLPDDPRQNFTEDIHECHHNKFKEILECLL